MAVNEIIENQKERTFLLAFADNYQKLTDCEILPAEIEAILAQGRIKIEQTELSGSEAVFGFAAWLTTRKEVTKMGSNNDCSIIAELCGEFCKANSLEDPRYHWEKNLIHPE